MFWIIFHPSYFLVIILDVEGVVADDAELVCEHMADYSVLLQDHGKDVVAECASGLHIKQIAIPYGCLDWYWISEFVNHGSGFLNSSAETK